MPFYYRFLIIALLLLLSASTLLATPPNVKVNSDVTPFLDNEEQIWVSPNDANIVIANWRDWRLGYRRVGVGVSTNGGATRSDSLFTDTPFERHSDPCLVGDRSGNFYANMLNYQPSSTTIYDSSYIVVYRSTDDGTSWTGPVPIQPLGNYFEDKQFTATDRTMGTYDGNYYVSWSRFPNPTRIIFVRSVDGAASFQDTVKVGPAQFHPDCGFDVDAGQFSIPIVDANGNVHVFWQGFRIFEDCVGNYATKHVLSTDGGVTFSSVEAAFDNTFGYADADGGVDIYGMPNGDCDISGGPYNNTIYISQTNYNGVLDEFDVTVIKSTDGGTIWSERQVVNDDPVGQDKDQFHPWLVVNRDGVVLLIYYDQRDDPSHILFNSYFSSSFDGGETYTTNYRISDVSINPALAKSGQVNAVPNDVIEDDGTMYADKQPERSPMAPQAGLFAEYIGVHSNHDTVSTIWTDTRNGNQDAYSARFLLPFLQPRLYLPIDNSTAVNPLDFRWSTCWHESNDSYRLEISTDPTFTTVDHIYSGLTDNNYQVPITLSGTHYWRVKAFRVAGDSTDFSEVFTLNGTICVDSDGDGYGDPGNPNNTCPDDNCPDIYNPGQEDFDSDGTGDVCDTELLIVDTIATSCTRLAIRNDCNFGNDGNGGNGGANLDFSTSGDCDNSQQAKTYLFEASPYIAYVDGSDTIVANSMYTYYTPPKNPHFLVLGTGNPTVPTQTNTKYDLFQTGTAISHDYKIGVEKIWWAPKNPDSCQFVIQCMKIYSYDGANHSGLSIGEIVDWDIPSDSAVDNTFGFDVGRKLLYQQGVDYVTGPVGCQANSERLGGTALLGFYLNDIAALDTTTQPFGAQALELSIYGYPLGGLVPEQIYPLLKVPGYTANPASDDLFSIMSIFDNYTLSNGDTLYIYTSMASVRDNSLKGSSGLVGLQVTIDKAKQWFNDLLFGPDYICGDADSSGSVDISDAVYLIAYIFGGGPAPDPLAAGDPDCSGSVDISDAVYLIAYIFGGGPVPCAACP